MDLLEFIKAQFANKQPGNTVATVRICLCSRYNKQSVIAQRMLGASGESSQNK